MLHPQKIKKKHLLQYEQYHLQFRNATATSSFRPRTVRVPASPPSQSGVALVLRPILCDGEADDSQADAAAPVWGG